MLDEQNMKGPSLCVKLGSECGSSCVLDGVKSPGLCVKLGRRCSICVLDGSPVDRIPIYCMGSCVVVGLVEAQWARVWWWVTAITLYLYPLLVQAMKLKMRESPKLKHFSERK